MEYNSDEKGQLIPCYENNNCGNVYNCGGVSGDWACDSATVSKGLKTCPEGTEEGWCWGSDPNFCSGINVECPDTNIKCGSRINPAETILGDTVGVNNQWLGCDVQSDPGCLEFTREQDIVSDCSSNCWDIGGRYEVSVLCNNFKDIQSCNSMDFFCDWNFGSKSCKAHTNDPFEIYYDKYGIAPDNVEIIDIVQDNCQGDSCRNVPGAPDDWYVTCARSSYDSEHMTSYANTARTCCLHKPNGKKYCISNPRCQFVKDTCECGMKDIGSSFPYYMCAANYNSQGTGYCTWCKGQHVTEIPDAPDGYVMKNKESDINWLENCDNRCSNYNECEVNDSEYLWNQCVYEKSGGTVGLSSQEVADDPSVLSSFGFCLPSCPEDGSDQECEDKMESLNNLRLQCEDELRPLIRSRNEHPIYDPTTGPWSSCEYSDRWEHVCLQNPYTGKKTTINYACSWCPELQDPNNTCNAPELQQELDIPAIVGGTVGGAAGLGLLIGLMFI